MMKRLIVIICAMLICGSTVTGGLIKVKDQFADMVMQCLDSCISMNGDSTVVYSDKWGDVKACICADGLPQFFPIERMDSTLKVRCISIENKPNAWARAKIRKKVTTYFVDYDIFGSEIVFIVEAKRLRLRWGKVKGEVEGVGTFRYYYDEASNSWKMKEVKFVNNEIAKQKRRKSR